MATVEPKLVQLFVDRYDADKDGKLSFWEFSNAILPIDQFARDEIERRAPVWEVSDSTKEALRILFNKILLS